MLIAHLVPGYCAVVASQPKWNPTWNKRQRAMLWMVALGSAVMPDLDVIYNALVRGFVNHSTLWTHSLFIYLAVALSWWLLVRARRWPYLRTLVGLGLLGGLSHLFLDVVSHGTPLFYPLSMIMVGAPSQRVMQGDVFVYMTDPIFLLEPFLLAVAAAYRIRSKCPPQVARGRLLALLAALIVFTVLFLLLLPTMQRLIPV